MGLPRCFYDIKYCILWCTMMRRRADVYNFFFPKCLLTAQRRASRYQLIITSLIFMKTWQTLDALFGRFLFSNTKGKEKADRSIIIYYIGTILHRYLNHKENRAIGLYKQFIIDTVHRILEIRTRIASVLNCIAFALFILPARTRKFHFTKLLSSCDEHF